MLIVTDTCSRASTDNQYLSFVTVELKFVRLHPSLDMFDKGTKSAGRAELKSCVSSGNLWRSEPDWRTMRETIDIAINRHVIIYFCAPAVSVLRLLSLSL